MRNCGNCDLCVTDSEDLICVNDQSEYLGDYVEESHCCDGWSGSEDEE